MTVVHSSSVEQTYALGRRIGRALPSNSVVCLSGDLGAGKTQLVKGIVEGATHVPTDQVSSPTFVYLCIYEGARTVYHFDLYRLHDADEFLSMGFDEYLAAGGIACIEWPERIEGLVPQKALRVHMTVVGEEERIIHIEDPSKWLS